MANIAMESASKIYKIYGEYSWHSANYYDKILDHIDSGNNKIYHTVSSNLYSLKAENKKLTIASTPGRSALNFDYNFYDYMDNWDSEKSIVMPWLGYIDIKNWLPQKNLKNYKSVDEVIDIYVEKTLNKFKKSKIIFINPMPQFEVIIAARWANFSSDPAIDFEDRHTMHLEFTESLKSKCQSLGLVDPVNISEILNAEWVDTGMQFKRPLKDLYNDHLRPEFYDIILTNILQNLKDGGDLN